MEIKKLEKIENTLNPQYYQVIDFAVKVRERKRDHRAVHRMTPPVFAEVWDWDMIGSDEIMCSARVDL